MGGETHYGPESRFVTVSLNGEPQGIYRLSERIKIDDDRVNIPPDNGGGTSMVLKLDGESEDVIADLGFLTDAWQIVSPNPPNIGHKAVALTWLNTLDEALDDGSMFEHLNLENVVDWVLLQEFSKNIDGYQLSVFFAITNGEKANLIPWDFDLAFGQPTSATYEGNDSAEGWLSTRSHFIDSILSDEAFQERIVQRWGELRADRFSDASLNRRIDQYLVVLSGAAIDENFSVWPLDDVDITSVDADYSLYPVDSYADEIATLRNWILDRMTWMDANIESL
jgi:spore coat protein CotH